MKELLMECQQEIRAAPPVAADRLVDTVEAAKRNLPNFQYRRIQNTTATAIFPEAHESGKKQSKVEMQNTQIETVPINSD